MKDKDIGSLEHTMWRCQYHVVFAPKYRRLAIYGEIKQDIGRILRQLCQQKGVEIIEAELCKDHVHMLLSIPPKYEIQVWQPTFLGEGLLCRHCRAKQKADTRIHKESIARRSNSGSDKYKRVCRPVYG